MARARRLGLIIAVLASLSLALAFSPAQALPYDHAVAGNGVDGLGNRLTVTAYDSAYLGGTGAAVFRLANSPGPATAVTFDCEVVAFAPSHYLYASGKGTDGKTWYIGVFDNTPPTGTGPYDVISITSTKGSGPCGTAAPYPNGWYPVSSGDFYISP